MIIVYVLVNLVCKHFIERFCIYIHRDTILWFSYCVLLWLQHQGYTGLVKIRLGVSFLFKFLEYFEKNWHYFSFKYLVKVKVKSLSCVQPFVTTWTVAHQAPPSMGFSRQEYWSEVPFPSPGDLPDPGIEPRSSALQADVLTSEPPGKQQKSPKPELFFLERDFDY